MPDFEILSQMIEDRAKVTPEELAGKYRVCLVEPINSSSVTIAGLPEKTMILKTDEFRAPASLFKGSKGECKRADFVIIADTGRKKVILCIEMKSGNDPEKEIIQQLKGARCLIAYCREIGRTFWDQQNFLNGYSERFVCLKRIGLKKRPTRIDHPSARHDKPERMLKISSPSRLEFKQLAG